MLDSYHRQVSYWLHLEASKWSYRETRAVPWSTANPEIIKVEGDQYPGIGVFGPNNT